MTSRRWGLLIFLCAIAAGVIAFHFDVEPVLVSFSIVCIGLTTLTVVVVRSARRKLAANRADLMRAAGMCPACGYTIRAATDRCPECGMLRT